MQRGPQGLKNKMGGGIVGGACFTIYKNTQESELANIYYSTGTNAGTVFKKQNKKIKTNQEEVVVNTAQ